MVKRNFRENPVTTEEMQECRWYAVVDDTIGGYNISNIDKPTSQASPYNGEFEIGCFMTKAMAQHVADIHNAWWERVVWDSYHNNLTISTWYNGLTEDEWFDYSSEHEAT